jgi:gamma-glutamylcyclotransferase (GGCT)/AIG2-like uncharacterized protein YtfP
VGYKQKASVLYENQQAHRLKAAREARKVCTRVFVYGSLKEGEWNNRILSSSERLTTTKTLTKFALGDVGFPYAFPPSAVPAEYDHLLYPVRGEVFEVHTDKVFAALDSLEGFPSHYDRSIVDLESGHRAWMYFQPDWTNAEWCDACKLEEGAWSWPA